MERDRQLVFISEEEALFEAVEQEKPLFNRIDLKALEGASSIQQVKGLSPVKQLCRVFSESGLDAQLGFNPGTGAVSLTVAPPCGGPGPAAAAPLAVWCMLGVLRDQRAAEASYRRWREGRGLPAPDVLANECLKLFSSGTGVAVSSRSIAHGGAVRVTFCRAQLTIGLGAKARAFRYAPSYTELLGSSAGGSPPSPASVGEAAQGLVARMVDDFWRRVAAAHYIPDETLQESFTGFLRRFLASGVSGQEAIFHPQGDIFQVYLWGAPGIGKSEFVKQFRAALEAVVQEHVQPDMTVSVVKVLLNAMTKQSMKAVANVKGISDMSIERLCEQSLAKGHIVILHLEENPEDPQLQADLYEVSHGILSSLVSRYRPAKAHIVYLYTSNYPASETIRDHLTVVNVRPPSPAAQRRWCEDMLRETVQEITGRSAVSLEADLPCIPLGDMRRLKQWWMSVGFHVGARARQALGSGDSDAGGGGNLTVAVSAAAGGVSATVSQGDTGAMAELTLRSEDGVFHFPEEEGGLSDLQALGIPQERQPRIATVVRMCLEEFLRPAVVVLTGRSDAKARHQEAVLSLLRREAGADCVSVADVSLQEEDDKVKVFGAPSEVQGGLFKFINEVNGAGAGERRRFAAITAHVSATGQFMLRELLEGGASSTHRLGVRKERVLFILDVNEGEALQPQFHSRAHEIFAC